jgi:CCR4-NOT transcription complex subunit 2
MAWVFGALAHCHTLGLIACNPFSSPILRSYYLSSCSTDNKVGSEFPSLSNNQPQQPSNSAQSTWSMPSTRNLGQTTSQRPTQQSMLPVQQQSQTQQQMQQQQEDLFSPPSQLSSAQGGFRFGNQTTVGQSSQSQVNPTDEFPPLNRNINGEIGQDRSLGLGTTVGFGAQSSGLTFGNTPGGSQGLRNNGLLNALSSSIRTPSGTVRVASPGGFAGERRILLHKHGALLT